MNNSEQSAFGYGFANEQSHQEVVGLTKREYMASQALQGLLANLDQEFISPNVGNVEYMVGLAVKAADALLKELNK